MCEENRNMNRSCGRNRSANHGFARFVAGITVLCAVFALTIPAFAQEPAGKVLHTHGALCRDSEGRIICPQPELEEHTHADACYEAAQGHIHADACYTMERGALTCQMTEQAGHVHTDACYAQETAHTHTDGCYVKQKGDLICTIPEAAGHAHGSDCYVSGSLICATEESDEHTHGASCYEKILNCVLPEAAGHAHSDACFAWTQVLSCDAAEKVLICTETEQTAHVHGDGCYEWTKVLHCTEEEGEKILICTKPELKSHIHAAICYDSGRMGEGRLICNRHQLRAHQHTQDCLTFAAEDLICTDESAEHSHSHRCYRSWSFRCQTQSKKDTGPKSNPNADVETAAIWEKTFEHVKLTGAWSEDLLAIAQTQLGYRESDSNFQIENGYTKGYTRYGEWYGGVEYGDWCAMFIAFCMHYAGIEGVPVSCGCEMWIELLKEEDMYTADEDYIPRPGDLVFFDSSRTPVTPETVPIVPDHVAIVVEMIPATEDEPAAVVTIEGNYYDCVRYETRYLDDVRIMGYGLLPDGPAALYSCGLKMHTHGSACFDEAQKLICGVKEHTHTESCRSRKLRHTDDAYSVEMILSDAVYLPANLHLRVVAATEQEALCRVQLMSGRKPYELPAGVRADVKVTFADAAVMDAVKRNMMLFEEASATGSYKVTELTKESWKDLDDGTMMLQFSAERISAFSIAEEIHQPVAPKSAKLKDLISKIAQ